MRLLVTFSTDAGRCDAVIGAIKSLGEWSLLTPSSYLLETNIGPGRILETLQPLLGPNDGLWVFSLAAPWAGYGAPEVEDHAVAMLGLFDDWAPTDWNDITQSRPAAD